MEELRVPTRRVEVDIALTNGCSDQGTFYLAEPPYPRSIVEDLAEFLNDERTFVPFSSGRDHVGQSLICKRHLRSVRAHELDPEWMASPSVEQATAEENCVLLFDDDSRMKGKLVHAMPVCWSRLLDKFNHAPAFLAFLTANGLEFVQVAHIVRIVTEE